MKKNEPEFGAENEDPVPLEISSLAALKRAIRPGTELMATYHSKYPEIVGLVRVVTEVQTNAFYSVIKGQPYLQAILLQHPCADFTVVRGIPERDIGRRLVVHIYVLFVTSIFCPYTE